MSVKIIAVANQKGGVGKTTTAVNLSASLALAEAKVLLVDFDPQGNASSGLGFHGPDISASIYNVLTKTATMDEIITKTEIDGLHLAPASIDLSAAEVELINEISRERKLQKALATVQDRYDFIIIDCPPSLGLLTVNALTAAGSVLIPLQCEYYALEGLSQLLNTVELIKENLNSSLDIEGILLTMYDGRNNLAKEVLEQIKTHFPEKVFNSVIPRAVALSEAPSHGKPIMLYQARSKGSDRYIDLAKEVLTKGSDNI